MSAPTPSPSGLRSELIRGSIWMVGARWVSRGIGIASVAVLARLLLPADFGLVAMAWLVIGLLEVCSSFGLDYALIRNAEATRAHFDTAWTLRLIQSSIVAAVAMLSSPLAAQFFDEPRLAPLLIALGINVLIGGWANIGPVLFRKELAFSREFAFTLYARFASTAATVVLAFSLRNYWALVAGTLVGTVVNVALSYRMHPYRPRWCLAATRELWGFSQWMLLTNLAGYVQDRIDQLIVGRLLSTRELGLYNVAGDVASLPTSEVLYPMSRVLFPGFSKLAGEPARLRQAYFEVVGFLALLALPAGVGIALVARDLVLTLLGENWREAVPLLQGLALCGVARVVWGQAGNVLLVLGHSRTVAALAWVQFALMVPGLLWAGATFGVMGIVWAKLALGGVMGAGQVWMLRAVYAVSVRRTLLQVARPLFGTLVMAAVLLGLEQVAPWRQWAPALRLGSAVALGAGAYLAGVLAAWWACGRAHGPERFLLDQLRAKIRLPARAAV